MEIVKGFRDFTGEDALKREKIKEVLIKKFKTYGFIPAETPVIEYEEFVKGNNPQDEAISDVFKLKDKGQRNLALRYELTFQLKRISKEKRLPFRRYQIAEVFRDEPVSSNRFRQFTQCDVDVIGSTIRDDAEVLKVFSDILKELKVDFVIEINNRKLLYGIMDCLEGRDVKNKNDLIFALDELNKKSEKEIRENLIGENKEIFTRLSNTLSKKNQSINELKKYILGIFENRKEKFEGSVVSQGFEEIEELLEYCKNFNVEVEFSPTLARGLSYYNGSVFEIFTKKMKESIAGGGSYLVNNIQSTGISFGLERLSNLVEIKNLGIKCLIISINQEKESIKLAQELREKEISCFIMDKLSKGLDYADKEKIPFVLFLGSEEIKKKKIKIRDMKTGKENLLTSKQLLDFLKN